MTKHQCIVTRKKLGGDELLAGTNIITVLMTVMLKKYHVKLEAEERARLQEILSKGKASAHAQRHARILMLADTNDPEKGWKDARIAEALATCVQTVERLRKLFVDEGFDRAMAPKKPDRHYVRKLDGSAEARLVALACGPAQEGRARWPRTMAATLVGRSSRGIGCRRQHQL